MSRHRCPHLLVTTELDVWRVFSTSAQTSGRTALHMAASLGKLDVLVELTDEWQAQLDLQDHEGATPLLTAAVNNHVSCLQALLTRGADALIPVKVSRCCRIMMWLRQRVMKLVIKVTTVFALSAFCVSLGVCDSPFINP